MSAGCATQHTTMLRILRVLLPRSHRVIRSDEDLPGNAEQVIAFGDALAAGRGSKRC